MEEGKDAKEIHERKREKRNGCSGKGEWEREKWQKKGVWNLDWMIVLLGIK